MAKVSRLLVVRISIACALSAVITGQGQRALSLEAIYDPAERLDFNGSPAPDVTWIDDARYLVAARGEWVTVEAASGRSTPLFERSRLEQALTGAGATREEARFLSGASGLTLNPARTGGVLTLDDDLYFYGFGSGTLTRLTRSDGDEEEATFSPDGRRVAFIRSNNLYVVDVDPVREWTVTVDGTRELLNGKLDWLYQEEIYGRGRFRAFWWSPDSVRLAFLQLDERPVPEYTVVDHLPYRPRLEVTDYPKAGDPNPLVRLGISRVGSGAPIFADLGSYAKDEPLVVNVDWTPDSKYVVHAVQNREQTWLDLNLADVTDGRIRRLLRETTKAWVNELGNPIWMPDGSFLWLSERSGFKHLYHVNADGQLRRQVTNGRWDVRTLFGVDQRAGAVYFGAGARRHLDTDVFRIGLDGQGLTRLSRTDGTHRAVFSPGFTQYVDTWSDVNTPAQTRLHRVDGSEVRTIDANDVRAVREARMSTPEFVEVRMRDGFITDAMMIKPPDFVPTRRYPVYQFTYAGPGTAQVRNQWGGSQYMFHQLLAQRGVIVWVHDNRSAGGRGVEAQWPVYGKLGEQELEDLEDGVRWLRTQSFVDPARIVLSGWSYGGFMTAYAMTHSTSWAGGIVGAPVTDWRDYDTIYTERYMKLPKNNEDGYRRTAPRFAAGQLRGQMLLLHGTMDDNVHLQNSLQFAYELQRNNKPFEMMLYPRSRHGISDPQLNYHVRRTMLDFVMRVTGT